MFDSIYKRFNNLIFFTTMSGLYIPGTTFFIKERHTYFVLCYSFLVSGIILLESLDHFVLMVFSNLPTMDKCGMFFMFAAFFWSGVLYIFFIVNGSQIANIFTSWNALQPRLFIEYREEAISKGKKRVERDAIVLFSIVLVPMIIVSLSKIFWTRALFFRSTFDDKYDNFFSDSDLRLLIFQVFCAISLNSGWIMSEAVKSQLMRLLVVEYQYLNESLDEVLKNGASTDREKDSDRVTASSSKQQLVLLNEWISYHIKVLRLKKYVENWMAPFLAGELLHLTVASCGIIFNTISIKMPADILFLSYVYVVPRIVTTYRLCRLGDELITASNEIPIKVTNCDWIKYPRALRRKLITIQFVTLKSASIQILSNLPLSSETFRKAMLVQYRFFTFLQDIDRRAHNKKHNIVGK